MRKRKSFSYRFRKDIYGRDNGACWACKRPVDWNQWELGHIVEFSNGGSDSPDNLAVMCFQCNRYKPGHSTREEAEKWARGGGWIGIALEVAAEAQEEFKHTDIGHIGEQDITECKRMMTRLLEGFLKGRA